MDKQATIGFILIGLILMVWLYWTTPQTPPPGTKTGKDSLLVLDSIAKNSSKPKDSAKAAVAKTGDSTAKAPAAVNKTPFSSDSLSERRFTVENDLVIMEFSTKGGGLRKIYLKDYKNWYNDTIPATAPATRRYVQLLDTTRGSGLSLEFVDQPGRKVSTSDIVFNTNSDKPSYKLKGKDSLVVEFSTTPDSNGSAIAFRYTIHGDRYDLGFNVQMKNLKNVIARNQYQLAWRNGLNHVEQYIKDEANYSNASVMFGDEHVIFNSESGKEEQTGQVNWMSVKNKYFTSTLVPVNPQLTEGYELAATNYKANADAVWKVYDATVRFKYAGDSVVSNNFMYYVGPADYKILKDYGSKLSEIVDFGSFFGIRFLVRPIAEFFLLPLFVFLYSFIPNYGIVIIIFSLIIKIILHPLTKNTYASMKKMQLLQPKIKEIKEKYKDDAQKQQKETMALYSTYGINPAGGCLPMILQMPVFIALFGTFQTAIQLRGEGFIWWITDLSRPDVLFALPFTIPLFGVHEVSGLALLMGVTTFLQQKMTTTDPSQKALVYIMPVFLTILFMTFPSGLNLYYFMFNLFSIAQQYWVNNYGKQVELVPIPADKRKKGFMARLTDAAEKSSHMQQQNKKRK